MRILCLCKRRPQGRDLYTEPYGRFYHLPRLLAERGHEVHLLLLSHEKDPELTRREGNLFWYTVSVWPWGPSIYVSRAGRLAKALRPDWVIGFSDTWYGIVAQGTASRHGARSLIDAYDNFESYLPWLKPLHGAWRRALRKADVVTAAGPQLAAYMSRSAAGRTVEVVPMAADPVFGPLDRRTCRQRLGLPLDAILVGYAGALYPNRGIGLLFSVFEKLQASDPRIKLVLSGRLANGVLPPPHAHWLGYRPAEEVPLILNSLDLLFVINKPGAFGNYSYPAKLYEAMACNVQVVAADVAGTAWVLRDHPEFLARAGDREDFIAKALKALETRGAGQPITYPRHSWENSVDRLASTLR